MRRSIFSLSSVVAYLISLYFGLRAFVEVFSSGCVDDPTEFMRLSFMSAGNVVLEYLPYQQIDLLWLSLLIQMTVISVRFYAHAEAIDSNQTFVLSESVISKICRAFWIAPALVLPTLMAAIPAVDSSRYLLGIVATVLTIAYLAMAVWSFSNMEKWIQCQGTASKLSPRRRMWLSVSDMLYLCGFVVLTLGIWLSNFYGLACLVFILLMALCSMFIAISMVVFYGNDSRWGIYSWIVMLIVLPVCAATFFRLIVTIS